MYKWRDVWGGGGIFKVRNGVNFLENDLEILFLEGFFWGADEMDPD